MQSDTPGIPIGIGSYLLGWLLLPCLYCRNTNKATILLPAIIRDAKSGDDVDVIDKPRISIKRLE